MQDIFFPLKTGSFPTWLAKGVTLHKRALIVTITDPYLQGPDFWPELQPGRKIAGCYRLLDFVAQSSVTQTWKALDEETDGAVWLHIFPRSISRDESTLAALRSNIRRLRGLQIRGALPARELIQDGFFSAIVTENWPEGDFAVLQKKISTPADFQKLAAQLLSSIKAAHAQGVPHLDISPENTLVDSSNDPKLAGFATSRILKEALGKHGVVDQFPAFSSPQLVAGEPGSPEDDVYSIGRLFEMLLASPRIIGVPQHWRSVIQECLQLERQKRPSLAELEAALVEKPPKKQQHDDLFVPTYTQQIWPQQQVRRSQRPVLWMATILFFGILAGLIVFGHKKPKTMTLEVPQAAPNPEPVPSPANVGTPEPQLATPTITPALEQTTADELALPKLDTEKETKVPAFRTNVSVEEAQKTAPSAEAANPAEFTNSLGMKFVPAGNVLFSIWETRYADYEAFVKATNYRSTAWRQPGFKQGPEHPVVNVSWNDAIAFCKWLTEKEHKEEILAADKQYRLPQDLEWSNAVGLTGESGSSPESRDMGVADLYPWGKQWPPPQGAGNYTGDETGSDVAIKGYDDGFTWTSPVGSFTPNPLGLYDMGGNVWEWCMDWWNSEKRAKVLRGGSWYNGALRLSLLSSCRVHALPASSTDNYGFRCVISGTGTP